MAKKSREEELQTKYIQLQVLKQQLQAFIEEKHTVDERVSELTMTVDALQKLEAVTKGGEIWSSLGSSAFVRSDIKDTEKVLIAIGAGVVVREKRERAIEILQERTDALNKINNDIMAEIMKFSSAIEQLEPEVERLAQEHEAGHHE